MSTQIAFVDKMKEKKNGKIDPLEELNVMGQSNDSAFG